MNRLLTDHHSPFRIGILYPGSNDGLAVLLPTTDWSHLHLTTPLLRNTDITFPGTKRPPKTRN